MTRRVRNWKISQKSNSKEPATDNFSQMSKFLSYISYFKVQKDVGKFPDVQDMSIIKERCQVGKVTRKENDRLFSRSNPETNRTSGQHGAYWTEPKIPGIDPVFHFILNPDLPVYIKF